MKRKAKKKKGKHFHSFKESIRDDISPKRINLKKFSFKKLILSILLIIFIVIIIISGKEIFHWKKDNDSTDNILKDISKAVIEELNEDGEIEIKVDFEKLKSMNNQTVAWIKVNNTNIEYPVVQTKDNEYYLTHNFNKAYSKAGWIFADYRNSFNGTDKNTIVYGHNRMNGTMFANLEQTLKEVWYKNPDNSLIKFNTESEEAIYEIFSIYEIEDEDYYIKTDFSSDEDYQNFLNTLKKRSIYDFGIDLNAQDKILTLSTCTNYNNGRIAIHARKK